MQRFDYYGGGFVLHKIMLGKQKYSARYQADGTLIDCERVTNGRTANVPLRYSRIRERLQTIGKRNITPTVLQCPTH
jgi:hypothetical protein